MAGLGTRTLPSEKIPLVVYIAFHDPVTVYHPRSLRTYLAIS